MGCTLLEAMQGLERIPEDVRGLVGGVVRELANVRGAAAVALGGSYARGTQRPDSDVDLAIYCLEGTPLVTEGVCELAARLTGRADPQVSRLHGWGRWVNGSPG